MRYIVYEFDDYSFNDGLIDSFYTIFQPMLEGPTSMEVVQIEKELIFFRLKTDFLDIDVKFKLQIDSNSNELYKLCIVSKNEFFNENDIHNLCDHLYISCSIDYLDQIPIDTVNFLSKYFITVWNLKKIRPSKKCNDFSQIDLMKTNSTLLC